MKSACCKARMKREFIGKPEPDTKQGDYRQRYELRCTQCQRVIKSGHVYWLAGVTGRFSI